MFHNMKTDVIYYKTNTDFEMEFNLCGCCRMRLLTDKSPDKKTMIHSLSRAVSRSKIIIIVGSLFGENGTINAVAGAIGSKTVVTDNKTYGIKSNDEIQILSGSTPLVTSDGIFAGCIIESGPQSMILLTENKAVRKNVMHTLIHPYIEELYANELKKKAQSENTIPGVSADDASDPDEFIFESDAEADELDEDELKTDFITGEEEQDETQEEPNETEIQTDFITESDEIDETDGIDEHNAGLLMESEDEKTTPIYSEDIGILSEITEVEELNDEDVLVSAGMLFETDETEDEEPHIEHDHPDILSEEHEEYDYMDMSHFEQTTKKDDDYLSDDEDFEVAPQKFSFNLPILILTIVLLLTIAVLCFCIFFIPAQNDTTATAFIKETFDILFS